MREIKFRGKIEDNWWYVTPDSDEWDQFWCLVERNTLGQYIGRKDKNGKDVYEGDILLAKHNKVLSRHTKKVINNGHRYIVVEDIALGKRVRKTQKFEVIGNIWQNPELLPPRYRL